MKNLKVIKLYEDEIEFSNGVVLSSDHDMDCCETYYSSLFTGLTFNLDEEFFERYEYIDGYGVALISNEGEK